MTDDDVKTEYRKVSIIIPVHNSVKFLPLVVDSIFKTVKYPCWELIIVESASIDGTYEYCEYIKKRYPDKVKVIHEDKRNGITHAINLGINSTKDSDIYLAQDDTIFPELYGRDLIGEFVKAVNTYQNIGLLTTVNGWGESGEDYIKGFKWFGTWALYIPRTTIEKVGLLDEGFFPGPGDDIDYSFRVERAGLTRAVIDAYVDHHRMSHHMNDDLEFIKRKNAGYFRRKNNMFPSWREYNLLGKRVLLDERTFEIGGCLNPPTFNKKDVGNIEESIIYEKVSEIVSNFTENDVFVDIGANTGLVSLMMQKGKGKSIAYEPVNETYEVLFQNTQINNFQLTITPIKEALYSEERNYSIEFGEHSGVNKIIFDNEKKDGVTTTLDKSLPNHININDNIKLIKIDTEGNDFEVIKGALEIIKKHKPIIIAEDIDDIEQLYIRNLGYKTRVLGHNLIFTPKEEGEIDDVKVVKMT